MKLRVLTILLSAVTITGCTETPEPQSVQIEFSIKTTDGVTHKFDKSIPFAEMESVYNNYECTVELENQKYRVGFWANSYPTLPLSAVDIRYDFGNISGVGLAMPYKTFSVYEYNGSVIMVEVFSTKFLNSLKKDYPKQFKNNLNCQTF